MTPHNATTPPSAEAVARAKRRAEIAAEIRKGRPPSVEELECGAPFRLDSIEDDIALWVSESGVARWPENIGILLQSLTSAYNGELISQIWRSTRGSQLEDPRLEIYAAFSGDPAARQAFGLRLIREVAGECEGWERLAVGLAALTIGDPVWAHIESPAHLLSAGARILGDVDLAVEREVEYRPVDPEELDLVLEDRAELKARGLLDTLREGARPRLRVVPATPAGLAGARKGHWDPFGVIAGARLPLVLRGDVTAHAVALQSRFPHARQAISTVLRDLASADVVRFRPTLFVGRPGCGKTSLARAIAETVGLPVTVYSAAGSADSSLAGTSAQWHSSRPSVPLDLVRASRTANPLIVVDEIDKAARGSHNGSLVDALLGFLEPATARAYRDLSLEVEVDLSYVSWICTANNIRQVPGPLRDRLRVIEIPEPDWRHLGDLAGNILDDIARDRGLDRAWIEDLAQDELEVVHRAWTGGSLRRLRRVLEVIVDGRDHLLGRA